ncbi:MAG: preprotein translocase subunit SecE [Clostridia bacterium]|nr:preprotein translocase subunit SecE [Clostridia bacterium]
MANKKTKPTKETVKAEKSDEVLTEVSLKKNKKAAKAEETKKVDQKKAKKTKKVEKVKRNRGKEVVSELKKVNWPSFKKTCKQTGTVLAVVSVFMLAVLGIDSLVAWILSLITKI